MNHHNFHLISPESRNKSYCLSPRKLKKQLILLRWNIFLKTFLQEFGLAIRTSDFKFYYSKTCLYEHLYKTTTRLRRPVLSPPKPIPIQSFMCKTTTCLTRPATTFFVSQMKNNLCKTTTAKF